MKKIRSVRVSDSLWQKVKAKLKRASHLLEFFLLIHKSNEAAKQKEKEKNKGKVDVCKLVWVPHDEAES
jgi:hypothetical protein